jgi:S-adenosylmethionine synthetase
MSDSFTFASDSAAPGHPDKLCDRIADAIVDARLAADRPGGVSAECALASGVIFLALRHAGRLDCDPAAIARREIAAAGYSEATFPADLMTVILDATRDDAMPGPGGVVPARLTTVFVDACVVSGREPARFAPSTPSCTAQERKGENGREAWTSRGKRGGCFSRS